MLVSLRKMHKRSLDFFTLSGGYGPLDSQKRGNSQKENNSDNSEKELSPKRGKFLEGVL